MNMREIILETLDDIANNCGTSNDCQINFSAESSRVMIADRLESVLKNHVLMLMEDMACPPSEDHCCGGGCHE